MDVVAVPCTLRSEVVWMLGCHGEVVGGVLNPEKWKHCHRDRDTEKSC